jgi:hypothetical protein
MPAPRPPHPALESLRQLLAAERRALLAGDADAVSAAAAAKQAALDQLARGAAPAGRADAARLRSLARANRDNQRVAALRLDYVATRLAGLGRAAGPAPAGALYGQDGTARQRVAPPRFAGFA